VCAILRQSRGLLANDGGLVHLASALGVKTTAIFGPVDEAVYGPFIPPSGSVTLSQAVPCRPCYSRFHFPPCPHSRACLEELPVERVWSAVAEMV
jgi:heptosyltransferase II